MRNTGTAKITLPASLAWDLSTNIRWFAAKTFVHIYGFQMTIPISFFLIIISFLLAVKCLNSEL